MLELPKLSFSNLIAALQPDGADSHTFETHASWAQGRTIYGGLAAALAVEVARRHAPQLPPLRAAQFAFTGPLASGDLLRLTPRQVAAGRSSTFVEVSVGTSTGATLRALPWFGVARTSAYAYNDMAFPVVPPPEQCSLFFVEDFVPSFTRQFDGQLAGGARAVSGSAVPELLIWLRHRDVDAPASEAGLIALGDVQPPAAMLMFTSPAPISTATWSIDVVGHAMPGNDWVLARIRGEVIGDGYCSQAMQLWSADGVPLLLSRQQVAMYV